MPRQVADLELGVDVLGTGIVAPHRFFGSGLARGKWRNDNADLGLARNAPIGVTVFHRF